MTAPMTIKSGDTFSVDVQRLDANGVPVSMSGVTVTGAIQGEGFSDTLTVTVTDAANGIVSVTRDGASTANWPSSMEGVGSPRILSWDLKYDNGGSIVHSTTQKLIVYKGVA